MEKNARVLVIDDDLSVRHAISYMLQSRGFEVIEAESGEEGIDLARTTNPALILSDVHMPNLDGLAVLDRLRQDPTTVNIPFLFMTGRVDCLPVARLIERGFKVLEKPFGIEVLMDAVFQSLGKS